MQMDIQTVHITVHRRNTLHQEQRTDLEQDLWKERLELNDAPEDM